MLITGAGVDDGAATPKLLAEITPEDFPRLVVISGNNKYHNHGLEGWLKEHRPTWHVEVKKRPEGTRGFTPLEKRWVVERTNARNGRCRRNSKDYERRIESSAATLPLAGERGCRTSGRARRAPSWQILPPENRTIHQGKDSGLWTQDQTSQAAAVQPQLADLDEDGIIAGNGDLETFPDQLANVQA